MAFNSIHFLLFFPLVLAAAWALRRHASLRIGFLLAASYYFYMSWNVTYAGLILGSTVLDFFVAKRIHGAAGAGTKRAWLVASLTGNLGVLFLFKYYNFFADSICEVLSAGGRDMQASPLALLLPVGISFYTFQTLSYTIDVYRGVLVPTNNFVKFALFVSFFPQLVAGPIVRASHFLPQLELQPKFDDRASETGMGQMLLGVFKKVCIADLLGATLVDPVFASPNASGSWTLLIAMYGYAFQIYYDFSGYSDIAIGAARMLGFNLPVNFNRPYLATSLRNFWCRWHISLSTWLRDYLFIPLGGSRGSSWKIARNLVIVMLLGGLWHGAAWGFVLWGGVHGLLLVAGRVFHSLTGIDADSEDQPLVSRIARIAVTFNLVAGCLVMFRATDFPTLWAYLSRLVTFQPGGSTVSATAYAILALGMLLEWMPRSWLAGGASLYLRLPSVAQAGVITGCLFVFAAVGGMSAPFIYFQF